MVHIPVMPAEVIKYLAVGSNKNYIDATLGYGGHSDEILKVNVPNGRVLGFDLDSEILLKTQERLSCYGQRFVSICDSYSNMVDVVHSHKVNNVHGVLFDLGMSSFQLDFSGRGFSFKRDEPLDMRFGIHGDRVTATDLLMEYSENHLIEIFKKYGEERYSKQIAGAIVEYRRSVPITRTIQLVELVESAVPAYYRHKKIHCATKVFQALRMEVNLEVDTILLGLQSAMNVLSKGGRLVVITFHSIEDSLVKSFMKGCASPCKCPSLLPKCVCDLKPSARLITKKSIKPAQSEISENPRARSAQLRAIEKL